MWKILSSLDCKEIRPVRSLKEINSKCSFGRTDAETESGPLMQRGTHNFSQMLGKTENQKEKGIREEVRLDKSS